MSEAPNTPSVPTYRKDEVTIEALLDGEQIEAVLLFKEPVSISELANIKAAWEAGLAQGKRLAERKHGL